jgi:hypothetical protein
MLTGWQYTPRQAAFACNSQPVPRNAQGSNVDGSRRTCHRGCGDSPAHPAEPKLELVCAAQRRPRQRPRLRDVVEAGWLVLLSHRHAVECDRHRREAAVTRRRAV